eukprot:m.37052 g.37052  ORF g.37052 m.37052 type:complete len:191 (-) comp5812_c0_seq1:65-637(-)
MGRKLKHHEQKLLKKVDLVQFKGEDNLRVVSILRKYHIQRREDYTQYNKIAGLVKRISTLISQLDPRDPFRLEKSELLLSKLYKIGVVHSTQTLAVVEKLTASAFCRRRLPVVMVRLKMAETLREAVQLVEQGHVRVGPEMVTDPAFLVTRPMEDFVTWVDTSKIRRHIQKYNDKVCRVQLPTREGRWRK